MYSQTNRNIYAGTLVLSFFLGGSLGGLWETLWTLFVHGTLEWKSGVMFFPLCNPIYGTGALLISKYALTEESSVRRYLFALLFCSVAEFFFSYAEELVFGTVSWDYSAHLLNIDGRINLIYSLFWGVLGLVWSSYVLPSLLRFVERDNEKAEAIILVLVPLYVLLGFLSLIGMFMSSSCLSGDNGVLKSFFTPELMKFFYPTRIIAT